VNALKTKVYVEYKVEKQMVPLFKQKLDVICSFYHSLNLSSFELFRSRDDVNRFIEEVCFDEALISIETIKAKRMKLHDEVSSQLSMGPLKIFTFSSLGSATK
jgi:hypothetical protein